MNRVVVRAGFHQQIFVSGIAGTQINTLPPPGKTLPGLHMTATDTGIHAKIGGKEVFIPWSNVIVAELAPEEKPAKKDK